MCPNQTLPAVPTTPAAETWRRRPIRISLKDFQSWQPPAARDWAELPLDLICYVFQMLHRLELLMGGAAGACRSWRHAARDEPEVWRHVDMRGCSNRCVRSHVPIHALVQAAVRRSEGQCEAFWSDEADDKMLFFLADQAPLLKSLRLISCGRVSNEGFRASIKNFPLLEELELSVYRNVDGDVFESVAKSCPRLKHLRFIKMKKSKDTTVDDREATAIASMHHLRSLELYRNQLAEKTVTAILNSCTYLNLLIVLDCPNLTIDDSLLAKSKYAGLRIVTLREGDSACYDPNWSCDTYMWRRECHICKVFNLIQDMRFYECFDFADGLFPEDRKDYEDCSRYLSGVHVTDLDDEEGSRMVPKSLRRYLKINDGM